MVQDVNGEAEFRRLTEQKGKLVVVSKSWVNIKFGVIGIIWFQRDAIISYILYLERSGAVSSSGSSRQTSRPYDTCSLRCIVQGHGKR